MQTQIVRPQKLAVPKLRDRFLTHQQFGVVLAASACEPCNLGLELACVLARVPTALYTTTWLSNHLAYTGGMTSIRGHHTWENVLCFELRLELSGSSSSASSQILTSSSARLSALVRILFSFSSCFINININFNNSTHINSMSETKLEGELNTLEMHRNSEDAGQC